VPRTISVEWIPALLKRRVAPQRKNTPYAAAKSSTDVETVATPLAQLLPPGSLLIFDAQWYHDVSHLAQVSTTRALLSV
jgi:hypothetical protein